MKQKDTRELILNHITENLSSINEIIQVEKPSGGYPPFELIKITDQPCKGAITYCTIGISNKLFIKPDSTPIRHELLFTTYNEFANEEVVHWIFSIGENLLKNKESIELGLVINLIEPIYKESELNAVLFTTPKYFSEELYSMDKIQPHIVFAWIIPITHQEAKYIKQKGYDCFDEILGEQDPDLLDLRRESIIKFTERATKASDIKPQSLM